MESEGALQVVREDISPCLVSFEIQVGPERYASALDQARRELGRVTEVPGFRKGKAPMAILEKVLDPERVERLANETLMPDAVREVLDEHKLKPWDSPTVQVIESGPESGLKFRARVPLDPQVEPGPYVGLNVDRIVRPVTDEVVERELARMQDQHSRLEPREEGGVEQGDYIYFSLQELNEAGEPAGEAGFNSAVVGENLPDFDNGVLGAVREETRDIILNYPPDWQEPERAGKSAKVRVTISHIFRPVKPALDDEFANMVSEYQTLDELKQAIREAAGRAFQQMADEQVENDLVRQIVESSRVDYPPQMLEEEFRARVMDIYGELQQRGMTFQEYLERTGRTEEQFRSELEARIDRDIRVGLVLHEIGTREGLEVTPEEIDAQIQEMLSSPEADEDFRQRVNTPQARASIGRRIALRKTLDFLKAASNIHDVARSGDEAAPEAREE